MTAARPKFLVRDADPALDDGAFIVEAFDSALPHLASIGSGAQWGAQPFSERAGFSEETGDLPAQSERYRLTGEGDLRVFIAESEVGAGAGTVTEEAAGLHYRSDAEGRRLVKVGAGAVRDGHVASYVASAEGPALAEIAERGPFCYLEVMVSDFRAGEVRRGVGEALTRHIREYAVGKGMKTLVVDCWAGNDRRLNGFYEAQGFKPISDFEFKRGDGSIWPGTLFRMDL